MRWYLKCLKNYANFSGRASRREFCFFVIFDILFMNILLPFDENLYKMTLFSSYAMILQIPRFALCVRRLHDLNLSGWWLLFLPIFTFVLGLFSAIFLKFPPELLVFIPIYILFLAPLMFLPFLNGTKGDNRFGADLRADKLNL